MSCCRCKELRRIRKELRHIRFLVSRPHSVTLIVTHEENNMITFAVVLPAPPVNTADWNEIIGGELTVTLPDVEPIILATDKATQETDLRLVSDERFAAPQGTLVSLSFVYIDDAGNHGSAAVATVELTDTVPPVAPDNIGLIATGEVN